MIIVNARDYTSDLSFHGFIGMALSATIAIVISMYLIAGDPEFLTRARPVAYLWAAGSVIVVATLILLLKGRGMLFKIPLKLMDDGVIIQPVMGIRPKKMAYKDIASFEAWYGLGYRKVNRGCSVLTFGHGSVTSVEAFQGKDAVRSFAESARPVFEKNGFMMKTLEEADSLHFIFQKNLVQTGVRPKKLF